jgi:type VI protein secretion system component Hcp
MANTTIFLKVTGGSVSVIGSGTSEGHEEANEKGESWMMVEKISFGVQRKAEEAGDGGGGDGEYSPGGGAGVSSVQFTEISVTKRVDYATPGWLEASSATRTKESNAEPEFTKIDIEVCYPSETGKLSPYLVYELKQCLVVGHEIDLSEDQPRETLTIHFHGMSTKFIPRTAEHTEAEAKEFSFTPE